MGAEPQTQVSQADLIAAIQFIEDAAVKLRKIQRDLNNEGLSLKVHWVGEAAHAFDAVHRKWHERMDVILQSLHDLAEKIRASGKNYAEFNKERTEAINHIAALIDQTHRAIA